MRRKTEKESVLDLIFRKKDSRVNAAYMSVKQYLLLFFAVAAVNGFHMMIYQEFVNRNMVEANVQFVINVLMGYVFVVTALLMLLLAVVRHVSWNRPVRRLSEAAKKIAQGDFSVRIAPLRKDGK
jgi:nitrogen fixation/metabolism regulation signal transduction histidine kinase